MWKNIDYDKCVSFINCHSQPAGGDVESAIRPAVTISRLTGAGGQTVADRLVEYLQTHVPAHCSWTIFDTNLMAKVLEDHHLSQEIAKHEPEDHKPLIQDQMEEFLGLHPSTWNVVQQTAETIWQLASMGYVILMSRGAAVVTASLKNVYHVRLVGSVERRTERVQEVYRLGPRAAAEFVKQHDKGRARYLKEHYHKDIEDPTLYDLVVNTDRNSYDDVARMVGDAVIHRFNLARPHFNTR